MRVPLSYVVVAVVVGGAAYALGQGGRPPGVPVEPPAPVRPQPPVAVAAPESADVSPEEETNVRVYQSVNRGVVNITTRSTQVDDFLLFSTQREGSGSGSVLDRRGHILTNYHVIEDARQIAVTLFDSSSHEARLVGSDPNNDLAVLRIKAPADKLYPLPWGIRPSYRSVCASSPSVIPSAWSGR